MRVPPVESGVLGGDPWYVSVNEGVLPRAAKNWAELVNVSTSARLLPASAAVKTMTKAIRRIGHLRGGGGLPRRRKCAGVRTLTSVSFGKHPDKRLARISPQFRQILTNRYSPADGASSAAPILNRKSRQGFRVRHA